MPKRTKKEIAADWYRLWTNHLIALIESTRSSEASSPEISLPSDKDVFDCMERLRKVAVVLDHRPPCFMQFWTGEKPELGSFEPNSWVVQETLWIDDPTPEDPRHDITVYVPTGSRRRLTAQSDMIDCQIEIDSDSSDWFCYDKHGEEIIESAKFWLSGDYVQMRHRIRSECSELVAIDLPMLAEDLRELKARFEQWGATPDDSDAEKSVGDLVDRLWRRLNDGSIDLIDTSSKTRELLSRAWGEVEWAQRSIEKGIRAGIYFRNLLAISIPESSDCLEQLSGRIQELSTRPSDNETDATSKPRVPAADRKALIVAHLHTHHGVNEQGMESDTPVSVNGTANTLGIATGALSNWFKDQFGSHSQYQQACLRNPDSVAAKLRSLHGDKKLSREHYSGVSLDDAESINSRPDSGGSLGYASYGGDDQD